MKFLVLFLILIIFETFGLFIPKRTNRQGLVKFLHVLFEGLNFILKEKLKARPQNKGNNASILFIVAPLF